MASITPILRRQGDILIIPMAKSIPNGAKTVDRDQGRVILAYGEVTGHAHAILEHDAELFIMDGETADAADRFLRVTGGGATVVHDEHASITLPPGNYIIRRQREYSPEAIRSVAD
jgi:hypothetical protein